MKNAQAFCALINKWIVVLYYLIGNFSIYHYEAFVLHMRVQIGWWVSEGLCPSYYKMCRVRYA